MKKSYNIRLFAEKYTAEKLTFMQTVPILPCCLSESVLLLICTLIIDTFISILFKINFFKCFLFILRKIISIKTCVDFSKTQKAYKSIQKHIRVINSQRKNIQQRAHRKRLQLCIFLSRTNLLLYQL